MIKRIKNIILQTVTPSMTKTITVGKWKCKSLNRIKGKKHSQNVKASKRPNKIAENDKKGKKSKWAIPKCKKLLEGENIGLENREMDPEDLQIGATKRSILT